MFKWVVGILVAVVGVWLVSTYISYRNLGVTLEKQITAQHSQNQNVLSSLSLRVVEQMNVAGAYKTAVQDVIKQSMEGRFGQTGSNAMLQAFTEAYPGQLDPQLYLRVQASIESGRKDFENEQKLLISKVQSYELKLEYFWSGLWLSFAGYPRLNLEEYRPIISQHTSETYKTGIDTGIKF